MLTLIATIAAAQSCDPSCCDNSCVGDMADFAVSEFDIIGIDRTGKYVEVDGGWADANDSFPPANPTGFQFPYTPGITFSELEGSPDATEWGCGIMSSFGYVGNVACWGWTTDDEDQNAPPPMTDPGGGAQWQSDVPYAEMDISKKAGCAIGATGTVLAWSYYNQHSALEDARPTSTGYVQCSADDTMMCAVGQTNGGVDCWGNLSQMDVAIPTSGTYVDVSCRGNRYCWGVQDDGTLDFFGDDLNPSFMNNAPTATNIVEVHVNHEGSMAAVARDSDGYVWAWQYDTSIIGVVDDVPMAVGAYSQSSRTRRTTVKFSDIKIEAGNVCGLVSEDYDGQIECADATTPTVSFNEGDLVCWGRNSGPCAEVIHGSCVPSN